MDPQLRREDHTAGVEREPCHHYPHHRVTAQGEDILAWTENTITRVAEAAEAAKAFGDGFTAGPEAPDCVYGTGSGGPYLRVAIPGFEGQTEAGVEHFALHAPESILRRCAADRKILAMHQPVEGVGFDPDDDDTPGAYGTVSSACSCCGTPDEYAARFPCGTVRAIAEGYGWTEGER